MTNDRRPPKIRTAPKIQLEAWEAEQGIFRETFLSEIFDPEDNEVFRAFAKVQRSLVLCSDRFWHLSESDAVAHSLQSALADLRYLQGYLRYVEGYEGEDEDDHEDDEDEGDEGDEGEPSEADLVHQLRQFAIRVAERIGRVADEIEEKVGDWRFEP